MRLKQLRGGMRIVVQRQDDCSPGPSASVSAAIDGQRNRVLNRGSGENNVYSSDEDYESDREEEYENENEVDNENESPHTNEATANCGGVSDIGRNQASSSMFQAMALCSERSKSSSPVGENPPSPSGYNSADEHAGKVAVESRSQAHMSSGAEANCGETRVAEDTRREQDFEESLKREKSFTLRHIKEDGNCLFRAISDQMYGDEEAHFDLRQMCFDYMSSERAHFSQFVTEDFDAYTTRKRKDKCYGNHLEIQAMSELFNRPVEVYNYSMEPINVHQDFYKTDMPPIRLSYHRGNHYNSVIDPTAPSVGVGLGLPHYTAGRNAEQDVLEEVKKTSEREELDAYVLEESRRLANLEQIEQTERVLEESLIECSWRDHMESQLGGTGGPGASSSRSPPSSSKALGQSHGQSAFVQDFYENVDDGVGEGGSGTSGGIVFLPPSIQKLQAMGFCESQLIEAFSIFGDNVDNILCFLTAESQEWALSFKEKYFANQRLNREKNSLKRPADDAPM